MATKKDYDARLAAAEQELKKAGEAEKSAYESYAQASAATAVAVSKLDAIRAERPDPEQVDQQPQA